MVVLLFFGSKSIPTLARSLGRAMREFKEASDGIKREIEESARPVKTSLDQVHDGWDKTVEDIKNEVKQTGEESASKSS